MRGHDELLRYFQELAPVYGIPKEQIQQSPYQPVLQTFFTELSKEKLFDFSLDGIPGELRKDDDNEDSELYS